MIVIEGIEKYAAITPVLDEMVFPQDAQLVRDRGSVDTGGQREIANAELAVTKRRQHSLAGGIAQHCKEPSHVGIPRDRKSGARGANLLGMNTELVAKIVVRDRPPAYMCTLMHILRCESLGSKNWELGAGTIVGHGHRAMPPDRRRRGLTNAGYYEDDENGGGD
jgi:hypothetical protein